MSFLTCAALLWAMMKSLLRRYSATSASIAMTSCLSSATEDCWLCQLGSSDAARASCSLARSSAFTARSSRPARMAASAFCSHWNFSAFSFSNCALVWRSVAITCWTDCFTSRICFSLSAIACSSISSGFSKLSTTLLAEAWPILNMREKMLMTMNVRR